MFNPKELPTTSDGSDRPKGLEDALIFQQSRKDVVVKRNADAVDETSHSSPRVPSSSVDVVHKTR